MSTQMNTVEHSETQSEVGNTRTTSRSRGWCFTLNNYTETEKDELTQKISEICTKHIIGQEVGKNGTPHLQGWIYFKNACSFKKVKGLSERAHWEKARGNEKQNRAYCSKEQVISEGGITSFLINLKAKCLFKYHDVNWKPWQKEIIDIVESKPDSRTINWVVDKEGNSGKSFLTKYIALTRNIIIADGKKDNIFNQILNMLQPEHGEGEEFDTVILDVPRSSLGYINYGVLEQIKNGLVYSGKYKGGLCYFDDVHVIVFANEEPDYTQFSEDRWNIIEI